MPGSGTTDVASGDDTTPTGGGANATLSCTTTAGGTFTSPKTVTLTCSAAATIRYCLSASATCCDPATAGTVYTSPITVGATEGTYCLSYYGIGAGANSATDSATYVFNATAPDLTVEHTRVRYQTTELNGSVYINSSDFGGAPFQLRQVNLKSHDPGPGGLNLDCEGILTGYAALAAPAADLILGPLDASTITAGWQVENLLGLNKLVYGDNYITTLLTNAEYADDVHACSTTNVVLEDFAFFLSAPIAAEDGSNTIREFAGGFTPYGFFEASGQVLSATNGSNLQTVSSQELHSGLFAVFF